MMIEPKLSVILPVRNEEKFITITLDSILAQTFKDFELIIINDASEDKTGMILNNYISCDGRVKVIDNKVSLGVSGSINRGIDAAKGKYIARIDAGDIANMYRFQRQVEYMETFKDTFILGSRSYIINERKEIVGEWRVPYEVNAREFYKRNGVVHPTVIIRKELFHKIGKFSSFYKWAEDYEFWARALRYKFKINNLQEFLTLVMERQEGISSRYFKMMMRDTFKIKLKYIYCFLNFWNVLNTLRSFIGCILPVPIAKYLSRKYADFLSCKIFKKQLASKEHRANKKKGV